MIDWLKQRNREKRHILNKKRLSSSITFNKNHFLRQLNKLKQAIIENNESEIRARSKVFHEAGLIAPSTLMGCERLEMDIKAWRV